MKDILVYMPAAILPGACTIDSHTPKIVDGTPSKGGKWISKKISNWDFRWKFIDGGAFMSKGGNFRFAGISDDGLLAIDWETEKGESVRMAYDKGGNCEDDSRYVLKWEAEHGGFGQHAPEVIPEGPLSPLVLLKIK